jgi:enediyne polyketide synthase
MDGRGDCGESVAIIGMACRFPGARDPAEFHDLAVAGRDMFQPVAALPGRPLRAAVLDDWSLPQIADDPVTGGLWPDVGPVRKLAAEMTALALTDAGLREVAGTCQTGLIIASGVPGLGEEVGEEFGFPACGLFSRSAHVSSLHAVVAAAGALQTGELDLAVAGGVELGLDPVWLALQDRAGALGAGEMRVYAADPAGLLPGEGCGMVVLVRAADARAAGVPVYAEIAGWSTPPAGSERSGPVLLQAYQRAGVDPADVQLIEGQGVGTVPGDSAELAALTQLRRDGRDDGTVAALGAISACIGYARAAAGIASLVKAAVAMAVGTIPPGPGCPRPHPLIASREALLRLPVRPEPWPDGAAGPSGARRPRLAAVNSLGTTDPALLAGHQGLRDAEGIHLVLRREAETDRWAGRRRADRSAEPDAGAEVRGTGAQARETGAEARGTGALTVREGGGRARVFVLRGGDRGALAGQLDVIAATAAALPDDGLDGLARQLAAGALQAGDHPVPLRVALTAASPCQLAGQAGDAARLLRTVGQADRADGAAMIGSPEVRVSAGAGGSVVVLFPGCAESAAGQPALLAASLQALRTLDALGIRPAIGVGYGLAEITGLAWAGCIPMAEAARLVAQCGQVLRACACGTAAMARVTADTETARALSAAGRLHIAAYEGPRTHVLAGTTADVRELTRRAAVLGVAVEVLEGGKGAAPMHSPGMARCLAPLRSVFAGTSFGPPRRRLISTITGRLVTAEDDMARLLAGQVTRPVLFAQAMAQAAAGADLIMTAGLGPDAGLTARAAECGGVPAVPIPAALPAGNTDQRGRPGAALTQALAALFTAGALTDLTPFLPAANAGEEGRAREEGTGGGRELSGSTLASRTVPRMRAAEEADPSGRPLLGRSAAAERETRPVR